MATRKQDSAEGLSASLASSLDEHLSEVRAQIADRAYELASQSISPASNLDSTEKIQIRLNNLSQATSEIIAGEASIKNSKLARFFEYFPPFTCVCTILCITFAWLGLSALDKGNGGTEVAKATGSFLDIAKIFAGAIVGSTAATAISAIKSRRQSR